MMTTNPKMAIPLTLTAHQQAAQCAHTQADLRKGKQVYLNTLAIQAVKTYLEWLDLAPNWEESNSSKPIFQSLSDSADLFIEGKGRVECRPVLPGESRCIIPPQTCGDRLAYIAVQLNADLTEATLLGYLPHVYHSEVPLTEFQPLDTLLEHLHPVRLTQWLDNIVESGWQTWSEFWSTSQPQFAFRSPSPTASEATLCERGKKLQFDPNGEPIGLFIGIHPMVNEEFDISVHVYPLGNQSHLPPDLELAILDDQDEVVMQASSRSTKSIQLDFSAETGDRFAVKVVLGDISLTEWFMI
jgi:hypothetical protein